MPRLVIIDTQSLLDWLVFADRACRGWSALLAPVEAAPGADRSPAGDRWTWLATAPMQAEFSHVLARGEVTRGRAWSPPFVEASWSACAHIVPEPGPLAPGVALRCTDPDDQKFIDLALARGDCHLVTRDKALLRLARRAAQRRGVRVCTPAQWNADRAGTASP